MNTKILIIAVALAIVGAIAYLTLRNQRGLENALPPRTDYVGWVEAKLGAEAAAAKINGIVSAVTGTSMAPGIPGSLLPGEITAYFVIDPKAKFESIVKGQLLIWGPRENGIYVAHSAAARDGLGWITTGLNNPRSDTKYRVTKKNFVGAVVSTHTWKQ